MYKNKIKYWANEKGVSSKHLAKKCDVSRQTFSNWINNHTQPDLTDGAIIADELGITLNDLIERIVEEE